MSVLVRGMDLPTSCGNCHLRKSNEDRVWCSILGEYINFDTEFNGRKANCPLVEVPPHGRLIDASTRVTVGTQRGIGLRIVTVDRLIDEYAVRNVPTIIEAEGGEK